ncbi:MAG TPA: signal peptidase I [Candidatus Paceibacterota bacterium]|nr:signal peptidase I [Candidatus Paceibacterota bacterium]HMO82955.1 signal peptidase I [Candidatus Paceibacterota bacterium]
MNLFSSHKKTESDELILAYPHVDETEPSKPENSFIEIIRFSLIAILIVVPIRMFIAQPFIVSGASMNETFHNGEYLIVDQVSYRLHSPERGDVVIFRYPRDPSKFFIKRIIAIPGDTITIVDSTVTVTNSSNPEGIILDEPYIKSMRPGAMITEELGEREYFVMGDNRDESSDSRVWGVLQEERIIGKAFLRLFPPQAIDYLPGAINNLNTSSAE